MSAEAKTTVEHVARAMCLQRGCDPDLIATRQLQMVTQDGLTIIPQEPWATQQAWRFYANTACAAIDALIDNINTVAVASAISAGGMEGWDHIEDRMKDAIRAYMVGVREPAK